MSGAERVEPEVSPTPAKPRNNGAQNHSHCVCKLHYSLTERDRKKKRKKNPTRI